MERVRKLTQDTLIPIGALVVIGGLIYWAAGVESRASQALESAKEARAYLQSIDSRLSHMEGLLEEHTKGK